MNSVAQAYELLPEIPKIIKVGGKRLLPSLMREVVDKKGSMITVTQSQEEAEAQRFQLSKCKKGKYCISLSNPEEFLVKFLNHTDLTYIDEPGIVKKAPAKNINSDYMLCHKRDPLNETLAEQGWELMQDGNYYLWKNPPEKRRVIKKPESLPESQRFPLRVHQTSNTKY